MIFLKNLRRNSIILPNDRPILETDIIFAIVKFTKHIEHKVKILGHSLEHFLRM